MPTLCTKNNALIKALINCCNLKRLLLSHPITDGNQTDIRNPFRYLLITQTNVLSIMSAIIILLYRHAPITAILDYF